jgi:hypothetical protein
MPFKTMEANSSLWFIFYLGFTIALGFLQLLIGKRNGGKPTQQPYAGHHYERRQVKKMFKG